MSEFTSEQDKSATKEYVESGDMTKKADQLSVKKIAMTYEDDNESIEKPNVSVRSPSQESNQRGATQQNLNSGEEQPVGDKPLVGKK